MKSTEIRIGNLVNFEGKPYEIDSIAYVYPTLNTAEFGIGVVDWNNLEPIGLTEEWLLKFGFEKVGVNFEKDWMLLWRNLKTGTIDFVLNEPNSNKRKITQLRFVHQLQNLFYCLIGEELTVLDRLAIRD